jgi:hypothetical protein
MANPFDFMKSINEKKYMFDQFNETEYSSFLTNKNFSLFTDTIFHANEMNINSHLDSKMQYDYYFHSISKKKRFAKWPKKKNQTSDNISLISFKYKYNVQKAKEAISVLTTDQLNIIKEEQEQKGGT